MKLDDLIKFSKIIENNVQKAQEPIVEYSFDPDAFIQPKHPEPDQNYKHDLKVIHDEMVQLNQHMKTLDLQTIAELPNFGDFYKKFRGVRSNIAELNAYLSAIIEKYPFRN